MNFLFKPTKYKCDVENITLAQEDIVTMIELFVKENLSDSGKEVFYSHIDELAQKIPNLAQEEVLKDALYQAVLGEVSVKILTNALKDIEENPEAWKEQKA